MRALTSGKEVIGTARRRRFEARSRPRLASLIRHSSLVAVAILMVFPFYWMLASALKGTAGVFAVPIQWIPLPPRFENFVLALAYPGFPFLRLLWNSIMYAGLVTIGTVSSCAVVGYGLARLRFAGREFLFLITLATLMIPQIVTFIPTYVAFRYVGLVGTYVPLILPWFFGNGFFIFLLRQFFRGIPADLPDAAKVDGAGELRTFLYIMIPMVRPALIITAVFSFVWTWQEFFGPLVYLSSPNQYPLSLGLFAFEGQYSTDWPLLMAAAALTSAPPIILFFLLQRYFVSGGSFLGLKG